MAEWHKQRDTGVLTGPASKKRRTKSSSEQVELDQARKRITRLETELERTKTALEITGKVHALLESISESADTEPRQKP